MNLSSLRHRRGNEKLQSNNIGTGRGEVTNGDTVLPSSFQTSHNDSSELDQYSVFVEKYNEAAVRSHSSQTNFLIYVLLLFVAVVVTIAIIPWMTSTPGINLNLVTVYPYSVSSRIEQVEGNTELLVTGDNRDAVDAVRTSIAMANSLQYTGQNGVQCRKRGKRGIAGALLALSRMISSIGRSRGDGCVSGEVVLKPFDVLKMRDYLAEYGPNCFNTDGWVGNKELRENIVLHRFNEHLDSIDPSVDQELAEKHWNEAVEIWLWCYFANSDARGYIKHGTSIKTNHPMGKKNYLSLQEMLEDSRVRGTGISIQDFSTSELGQEKLATYSPIFVASTDKEGNVTNATKLLIWNNLHSLLGVQTATGLIHEEALSDNSEANTDRKWYYLEPVIQPKTPDVSVRWLAYHCPSGSSLPSRDTQGETCTYLVHPS